MLSFPPEVWGPFFWHTIHIVALGYPESPSYSEKKGAKEFFESLIFLIPCPVCRSHYTEHLQLHPITPHLDKRRDLFRWTVTLHNAVNTSLGKPSMVERDVLAYYKRLGNRGRSPVWTATDMMEADSKAFLRGLGIGVGATLFLGTLLYVLSEKE
jgi:hypothetical protein